MSENRIPNADLFLSCWRCGRKFPRMFEENYLAVCKVGECRSNWSTFPRVHQTPKQPPEIGISMSEKPASDHTCDHDHDFLWRVTAIRGFPVAIEIGPEINATRHEDSIKVKYVGEILIKIGTRMLTSELGEPEWEGFMS